MTMHRIEEIKSELGNLGTMLASAIEQVDQWKETLDNFDKEEHASLDEYDDMLNECNDMVEIGSMAYSPSQVLKSVDPIAYDCGFSEWVDSRDNEEFEAYQELQSELEEAEYQVESLSSAIDDLTDELAELEE